MLSGVGRGKMTYSRQFFGNLSVRKDFMILIPHAKTLFLP